jgi:hypothetical protein
MTHKFNWGEFVGYHKEADFSLWYNGFTGIEKSDSEVAIYSEPPTPGSTCACLVWIPPCCCCRCCIIPMVLGSNDAKAIRFTRDAAGAPIFLFQTKKSESYSETKLTGVSKITHRRSERRVSNGSDGNGNHQSSTVLVFVFEVTHPGGTFTTDEIVGLGQDDGDKFCSYAAPFLVGGAGLAPVASMPPQVVNRS